MGTDGSYKTINSLMAYLRNTHDISIFGSSHKRKLRHYGYYHGFKGYRFVDSPSNRIPYRDFNELLHVIEMDRDLKSIFYSPIMFLETALKNIVLEIVLDEAKSSDFNKIFYCALNNYKYISSSEKKKNAMRKRMNLRSSIYRTLAEQCDNRIISNFNNANRPVPIWAIFEVITLGSFANFVGCLCPNARKKISDEMSIPVSFNTGYLIPEKIIYILKDLRNAIAHNATIFDTRFRTARIDKTISRFLEDATGISNIMFNSLVDYLILIIYIFKAIGVGKTEMRALIQQFKNVLEQSRKRLPTMIFSQIILTDTSNKVNDLLNYI